MLVETPLPTPSPPPVAAPRTRPTAWVAEPLVPLTGLGLILGCALVVMSYSYAGTHQSQVTFDLFWAGILVFLVPAGARLCSARVRTTERWAVVALVGAFLALPKYLRDPGAPLFQDELAHWHQANTIVTGGRLFAPNTIIPILRYFPGLHALDASLALLSGASTWHVAEVLVVLLHVVSLLGVATIAERVIGSPRLGALAAFVYALNPSYLFFDTQFSYESLAIVLFIWAIAAVVSLQAPGLPVGARRGWASLAVVLSAACVITHHLTSYTLAAMLVVIAVVTVRRARRAAPAPGVVGLTVGLAVVVTLADLGWFLGVARGQVYGYLAPDITAAVHQVGQLFSGHQAPRTLFAGSLAPGYERIFAYLAPPVALAIAGSGLWMVRRGKARLTAVGTALAAFGLLYFVSLPFIYSATGNEGARRSWAFTYLGLALLGSLVVGHLLRVRRRTSPVRRGLLGAGLALSMVALLIGNATAAIDVEYRFPGPYVYGSDARSLTAELMGVSAWFDRHEGRGVGVLTDRYTGEVMASFGDERLGIASPGFPFWQLFFDVAPPSRALLGEMAQGGYRFVVVDERMAEDIPQVGVYVSPSEPGALDHTAPVPEAALTKFDDMVGVTTVLRTTDYAVYRLDLPAMELAADRGAL